MRKARGLVLAALLCGALIGGCGDSGGGTDFAAIEQALAECSESAMANMMLAFYGLVNVPDVIAGESPLPGLDMNVTVTGNPLVWDFLIAIDTNANAINDTAITGQVTFSEDPTDGFLPGATLHFVFTVTTPLVAGAPLDTGTLSGSGDLLATIGATEEQATISGTISLTDTSGEGCKADITFPVAPPVNFDFSAGIKPPGPVQLAANTGLFEIFGAIQVAIESLGYTLTADVTFTQDDQTVNVDGDIDGTAVDFDFELLPPDEVITQLFGCTLFGFEWAFFFADAYAEIAAAIGGGTLPPGVVLTPTANPNVFDYMLDLAVFDAGSFTAGTVSGQATLTFPVAQLSGITPSQVSFTWTIAGAVFTGGETASGQNVAGRPFRIRLDGTGTPLSFSGAGSITLMEAAPPISGFPLPTECLVTFDILENDPITASQTDGTAILTITMGEDVMTAVLDFDEEEIFATINGIPFPFFL